MQIINRDTKLFISVSAKPGNLGASVYNQLFLRHTLNAVYLPRQAPTSADELLSSIRALGICGCSVSMPLKSKVALALTQLDQIATETQSVNTILNKDGELVGYNTDYSGIVHVLSRRKWGRTLIYGAGGVTSSLALALKDLGVQDIFLTARDKEQAHRRAEQLKLKYISASELASNKLENLDLLISATPIGFEAQTGALADLIPQAQCVFDLVPSLDPTCVIQSAKAHRKEYLCGIEMFKAQLVEQFRLYTSLNTSVAEIEQLFKFSS